MIAKNRRFTQSQSSHPVRWQTNDLKKKMGNKRKINGWYQK
jgi:hypothetical protein